MSRSPVDRGLLILTSLAGGDKHGYALMLDIEAFAGVKLQPASLYGALTRLAADGLVEALPAEDRRRPFRITSAGNIVLRRALSENARIVDVGLSRLTADG
jgi:DNA-binding PadR family transcriptional regulator